MTVHEQAINWVCEQFPNAINNHYARDKMKFEGLIPDVVENGNIHEVEVVSDKQSYKRMQKTKTMWIVVPSFEVFNHINILGQTDSQFIPLKTFSTKVINEQKEVSRLIGKITNLKTKRNRLIRDIHTLEKQHRVKEGEAHRVLYFLPSFEFKKDLNPDKCIICNEESDLVIASGVMEQYGLCKRHFDALIGIDEK